jgi:prepilin peptidase CpaA
VQQLCMEGLLVALVGIGACTDLRERRIPNWLTGSMLMGGFLLSATWLGLVAPSEALAGAAVGLTVPLILYMLGGLKAGDVKLLCAIGAWVGPRTVMLVIAGAALAGLVLVLAQCLIEQRMGVLLRNTGLLALSLINLPRLGLDHVIETGEKCQSVSRPMPYALTVLAGTVMAMVAARVTSGGGLL